MKKEDKYKHGFKTPEDYFENFEDKLFSKLEEEGIPKQSGFEVPEDYFDSLEESVMDKVSLLSSEIEGKKPTKVVPLFSKRLYLYGASIAACAILALTLFSSEENTEPLELSTIESYLLEEAISLDSYDIAQTLNDDDLDQLTLDSSIFSEENLEIYLLENIDDNTLFYE